MLSFAEPAIWLIVLHFSVGSAIGAPAGQPLGYSSHKTCLEAMPAAIVLWKQKTGMAPEWARCKRLRIK